MSTLSEGQVAFFRLADVCVGTLRMGLSITAQKRWFGKARPTQRQIGYCYGFAEEMVDRKLGVSASDRAGFVQLVFGQLFGKHDGDRYVRQLLANEAAYTEALELGNKRYIQWDEDGRAPLPPMD